MRISMTARRLRPRPNDGFVVFTSKPPAHVRRLLVIDTWQSKGIKGGRAVVKEEQVRPRVLRVARVDPFVPAVMNPEAVVEHGKAGRLGRRVELVQLYAARTVQGNPVEGPFLGMGRRTIDAVPAVDVELFPGAFGDKRPGLGSLRIVPGRGAERVHLRKPRRTSENRAPGRQVVKSAGFRGGEIAPVHQDGRPAFLVIGAIPPAVLRRNQRILVVTGVKSDTQSH